MMSDSEVRLRAEVDELCSYIREETIAKQPALERRAALEAEITRLRAIVDKLPKTADGVPVVPGADKVYRIAAGDEFDNPRETKNGVEISMNWRGWVATFFSDLRRFGDTYLCGEDPSKCFSTREAAEKAKEQRNV